MTKLLLIPAGRGKSTFSNTRDIKHSRANSCLGIVDQYLIDFKNFCVLYFIIIWCVFISFCFCFSFDFGMLFCLFLFWGILLFILCFWFLRKNLKFRGREGNIIWSKIFKFKNYFKQWKYNKRLHSL